MIQFNLLPDVKLEYLRTSRIKRTVMVIAGITGSVALVIFFSLLITVRVLQKNQLDKLDKEVKGYVADLKAVPDIDKILTVQNQLNRLTPLHDQKPAVDRLFGYLTQITPDTAHISNLEIDFTDTKKLKIEGMADNFNTINKFADQVKFTEYSITYTEKEIEENKKATCTIKEISYDKETRKQVCVAFVDVVLTSYSVDEEGTTYEIDFVFDPLLFDSKRPIVLKVPNIITTRSVLEKPDLSSPLFQENPNKEEDAR